MSNIRRPFYAVKAGIALFLLAGLAQAQPQLLGPKDGSIGPTRTPAGFLIHGNGFIGRSNPNRIRKSYNFLLKHNMAGEVPAFMVFGTSIADHFYLPELADAAFERRKAAFIACGGKWEQAARNTSPRSITIIIEAGPFTHPSWPGYRLGGLTDGRTIRATIAHINGMSTNAPWLVTFGQTVEWELGNILAIRAGYDWTKSGIEIGDTSPCQR